MDKVIETVETKQAQQNKSAPFVQVNQIYGELSNTHIQVTKMLNRMAHHLPINNQKSQTKHQNQIVSSPQNKAIGKYNYYGKKYRFQQKEEDLTIEAPKLERSCMTQKNFSPNKISKFDTLTERQIPLTQKATVDHIDQNIFFDDGQIQMRSNNYYIYFDKPEFRNPVKQAQKSMKKNLKNDETQYKFKPAWVMQKKINNLQKQIKEMKQKEKKREFLGNASEIKGMRQTVDGPIRLQSNLQRMVQTLWK